MNTDSYTPGGGGVLKPAGVQMEVILMLPQNEFSETTFFSNSQNHIIRKPQQMIGNTLIHCCSKNWEFTHSCICIFFLLLTHSAAFRKPRVEHLTWYSPWKLLSYEQTTEANKHTTCILQPKELFFPKYISNRQTTSIVTREIWLTSARFRRYFEDQHWVLKYLLWNQEKSTKSRFEGNGWMANQGHKEKNPD